jgi:hypothetical protein
MRNLKTTEVAKNINEKGKDAIDPVLAKLDVLSKAVVALNVAMIALSVAQFAIDVVITIASFGADVFGTIVDLAFIVVAIGSSIVDILELKQEINDLQKTTHDIRDESSAYMTAYNQCGSLETDFNETKDAFDTYVKDNLDFLTNSSHTFTSKKAKMKDVRTTVKPILQKIYPVID